MEQKILLDIRLRRAVLASHSKSLHSARRARRTLNTKNSPEPKRTRTVVVPTGINTELVRKRMDKLKLNYVSLAQKAGLDPTRLSRILRYDSEQLENMRAGTLLTLGAALGVSIDKLVLTGEREIEIGDPLPIPKKNDPK